MNTGAALDFFVSIGNFNQKDVAVRNNNSTTTDFTVTTTITTVDCWILWW